MPRWKRRFHQFRTASGLSEEPDEKQVSTQLYCMGELAEDTLTSTNASADDRKKYDTILQKFDDFFRVRKNIIFERARFNRRSQQPDESAEQFITALYNLADSCEYGDLREELIRDRIVVSIRDKTLSERMQLDPKLTLESAKTLVRQREAVHEHQQILRTPPKQELTVEFIRRRPPGRPSRTIEGAPSPSSCKCIRCGKGSHSRQTCPAICHQCKKRGHYSSQCRLKPTVNEVTETAHEMPYEGETAYETPYDTSYLDVVSANKSETHWSVMVTINGQEMCFKLDTGAEVTVISNHTWELLKENELQSSNKRLCGPDNNPLELVGQLPVTLEYKGRSCVHTVYVVQNLQQNLLGLPAIQSLQLLTRVDTVNTSIPDQYPRVFRGLGTFPESYEIKLTPDALPFALFTPRTVPIPHQEESSGGARQNGVSRGHLAC